ncbi:hypothetical protein US8_03522 [Bacillus altitudinis]|nr:hypothetical protein US8_03522 [Bacillus altitudinis]
MSFGSPFAKPPFLFLFLPNEACPIHRGKKGQINYQGDDA